MIEKRLIVVRGDGATGKSTLLKRLLKQGILEEDQGIDKEDSVQAVMGKNPLNDGETITDDSYYHRIRDAYYRHFFGKIAQALNKYSLVLVVSNCSKSGDVSALVKTVREQINEAATLTGNIFTIDGGNIETRQKHRDLQISQRMSAGIPATVGLEQPILDNRGSFVLDISNDIPEGFTNEGILDNTEEGKFVPHVFQPVAQLINK